MTQLRFLADASWFASGNGAEWPVWLVVMSQVSNSIVAIAFLLFPIVLCYGWAHSRSRHHLPAKWMMIAFFAFMLLSGTRRIWNVLVFCHPEYYLHDLWDMPTIIVVWDALTAVAGSAMFVAAFPVTRALLAHPTTEEFGEQSHKARVAEVEARVAETEARRLREVAERKATDLQELANRLQADLHLHREAMELRGHLAEIRGRVSDG